MHVTAKPSKGREGCWPKKSLEKVRKAYRAELFSGTSSAENSKHALEKATRPASSSISKDDDSGREARPQLGVGQKTRTAYS